jgi:hypothetical protein
MRASKSIQAIEGCDLALFQEADDLDGSFLDEVGHQPFPVCRARLNPFAELRSTGVESAQISGRRTS